MSARSSSVIRMCDRCGDATTYDDVWVTSDCEQICGACMDARLSLDGKTRLVHTGQFRWTTRGAETTCVCGEPHEARGTGEGSSITCWCGQTFRCIAWDGFSGARSKRVWQTVPAGAIARTIKRGFLFSVSFLEFR